MTEQVLAERQLRTMNELLTAVLENIPCGVSVFDGSGRLVLDNQNIRAKEGDAPYSVVHAHELAIPESRGYGDTDSPGRPDAERNVAARIREEVQPDGRVLEVRDAPMPRGGLVTTYNDITQHKQSIETLQLAKAAAEQAAAAKSAFLAAMSHEIRTPMNGVIGMTNILLETRLTTDQREIVEVIRQSGESLLVVINDILDYSKIESGQMELEWLPLSIREVVHNSVRLLAPKAEEKQVAIAVEIAPDIPPLIEQDFSRSSST
jgi:signal transduction histidine kinase